MGGQGGDARAPGGIGGQRHAGGRCVSMVGRIRSALLPCDQTPGRDRTGQTHQQRGAHVAVQTVRRDDSGERGPQSGQITVGEQPTQLVGQTPDPPTGPLQREGRHETGPDPGSGPARFRFLDAAGTAPVGH